jgi:hypothetical protein
MHSFGVDSFLTTQLEQRTQHVTTELCSPGFPGNSESVAATGDFDTEPTLYLSQVLVKLSAKIGQAVVVGGFEDYVLGYLYSVQWQVIRPLVGSSPDSHGSGWSVARLH